MDQFVGIKYRLISSTDNFESYLKHINVGFLSRKAATSVTPTCILSIEGEVFTLTVLTALRNITTTFKLGEEFEEARADGVTVKSVFTLDGNKLIQIQTDEDGKTSTYIREFTPDRLIVTTTADGWEGICTRVYEKVN